MLRHIIPLIPGHYQYVEPFIGGGAVFFAKNRSKAEVINDINGWVVNFYRVCKENYFELEKKIKGTLHSEHDYLLAKDILKSKGANKIDLAWAFWVQANMSFSKMLFGGFAFGNDNGLAVSTKNKRSNFTQKYLHRLEEVEIFQRDACELIKLKDNSE